MCVSVCERMCIMEAYFCTELQLHRIPMHNLHKYLWNCDIDWVPHLKGKSHTLATLFDTLFCSHNMIEDCLFEQLGEILLSVCCCLADKGRFRSPPIDFQSSKTLKFGIKKNYWKIIGKGQIPTRVKFPQIALALLAHAILLVFEKFTRAYLFQTALKIMWLPIQVLLLYWSCINFLVKRLLPHRSC